MNKCRRNAARKRRKHRALWNRTSQVMDFFYGASWDRNKIRVALSG